MTRAAIAVAVMLGGGCKSPPPEYDGLGPWHVTRSRLKDATGNCQPTDLPDGRKGSYCFMQDPIKFAGAVAEIDLYFDGVEPGAKLIEEQLRVRGCREEDALLQLRTLFGNPVATLGAKVFWQNNFVFVAAIAPSDPGQCLIRVYPLSETAEIAKVRAP